MLTAFFFFYNFFLFLAVNRRLDEWVKLEQLDLDSVEAVVDEKVEDKVLIILYVLQIAWQHLFWNSSIFYLFIVLNRNIFFPLISLLGGGR